MLVFLTVFSVTETHLPPASETDTEALIIYKTNYSDVDKKPEGSNKWLKKNGRGDWI
jgi:hypothetical protein